MVLPREWPRTRSCISVPSHCMLGTWTNKDLFCTAGRACPCGNSWQPNSVQHSETRPQFSSTTFASGEVWRSLHTYRVLKNGQFRTDDSQSTDLPNSLVVGPISISLSSWLSVGWIEYYVSALLPTCNEHFLYLIDLVIGSIRVTHQNYMHGLIAASIASLPVLIQYEPDSLPTTASICPPLTFFWL